jgi:hypothetical protein
MPLHHEGQRVKIDNTKIKELIDRRIIQVPNEIKNVLHSVIKDEVRWVAFSDEQLILLIFLDAEGMKRIQEFSNKGYDLFPGFITTSEGVDAGMRMANSKYGFVSGCSVSGTYSFSVGPDSSFVVQNHTQSLKTNELGEIKYTIPLAYVVSFGEDTTESNSYEILEELISYSIKTWKENNEPSK